jgi:hypothetical protein
MEAINAFADRHPNLRQAVDNRKRQSEQLSTDPAKYAAGVVTELAAEQYNRQTLPGYEEVANQFLEQHSIRDPDQIERMIDYLGVVHSGDRQTYLRMSKDYAEYTLALDVPEPHRRAVVSAQRGADGPLGYYHAMDAAAQTVAEWRAKNPGVSKATQDKMRAKLAAGEARDLDDALSQVRRARR